MIRLCTKDSFIVHLDQFVVHCAPFYYFVKGVQSPNISLHQCLIMVLELISKLLARLGHSVVLSPASFFRHLHDNGKPKRKARSEYVKDVKKKVTPQDEEEKENIKVHLGIYERKTSASVAKEINKVDEDLKKAEEAVNALLAKRQRLTVVSEVS